MEFGRKSICLYFRFETYQTPLIFLNLSVIKKLLYIILITEFRSNATFVFKTKTRNIKIKILLCDTEVLWILEI